MKRDSLVVHFLRHGQATHNVRAEPLRAAGCTFEAFLAQMRADDEFDSNLTEKGIAQAKAVAESAHASAVARRVQWVVSSPHSRAVDTAETVLPGCGSVRMLREEWREISGDLINAKRLPRSALEAKYGGGGWDCQTGVPTEEDQLWTEELEDSLDCATRAYYGLRFLFERTPPEVAEVAVAGHGGIFHMAMNLHPLILADEGMQKRFENCELRSCVLTADAVLGSTIYGGREMNGSGGSRGDAGKAGDAGDDAGDGDSSNPFPACDAARGEKWEAWKAYLDKKGRPSAYGDQRIPRFHAAFLPAESLAKD